jgi:hypothetical protein
MHSAEEINGYFNNIGIRYTIREAPNQDQGWNKGQDEHGIWYTVTFKRAGKKIFSFPFGDSLNNKWTGEISDIADILESILYNRHDPGSFSEFCGDSGYDEMDPNTGKTNRESARIYKSVCAMSKKLNEFFYEEELDQLQSDEPLPVAPTPDDMVTGYDRSMEERVNARLLGYESTSQIIDYDIELMEGS